MGDKNPADIVPEHASYRPTLSKVEFNAILDVAKRHNDECIAQALANVVGYDMAADLDARKVDRDRILNYYKPYVDMLDSAHLSNIDKLHQLYYED